MRVRGEEVMNQNSSVLAGPAVLGYVVLTAAQGLVLGSLVQRSVWHPIILLVATLGTVTLLAGIGRIGHFADFVHKLRGNRLLIGCLNLISAVNWLTYYLAIRTVPVSSHAAIALGIGPVLVLMLEHRQQNLSLARRLSIAGIVMSAVVIASSLVGKASPVDLALSFVCGVSLVLTMYVQRRLSRDGWTAGEMLACRFLLLLAIGMALAPRLPLPKLDLITAMLQVVLLSAFGMLAPIYLLTWGQIHGNTFTSTMLLYLMPALMVGGELVEGRVVTSLWMIGGVAATCVFLIVEFQLRRNQPVRLEGC
jgi:drug/metabolite transporter (DMT)-like permease